MCLRLFCVGMWAGSWSQVCREQGPWRRSQVDALHAGYAPLPPPLHGGAVRNRGVRVTKGPSNPGSRACQVCTAEACVPASKAQAQRVVSSQRPAPNRRQAASWRSPRTWRWSRCDAASATSVLVCGFGFCCFCSCEWRWWWWWWWSCVDSWWSAPSIALAHQVDARPQPSGEAVEPHTPTRLGACTCQHRTWSCRRQR